ncbi:Hypothetical protein D9617_2g058320 [Elsinoe fawcettii]|nr:Hypothetical protein D9617_2g058320 [Elsinoe fawcettii]
MPPASRSRQKGKRPHPAETNVREQHVTLASLPNEVLLEIVKALGLNDKITIQVRRDGKPGRYNESYHSGDGETPDSADDPWVEVEVDAVEHIFIKHSRGLDDAEAAGIYTEDTTIIWEHPREVIPGSRPLAQVCRRLRDVFLGAYPPKQLDEIFLPQVDYTVVGKRTALKRAKKIILAPWFDDDYTVGAQWPEQDAIPIVQYWQHIMETAQDMASKTKADILIHLPPP